MLTPRPGSPQGVLDAAGWLVRLTQPRRRFEQNGQWRGRWPFAAVWFVTEAFRAGADAHAIMRQTGHRNPAVLETYAREHAPSVGNAVTRLGL